MKIFDVIWDIFIFFLIFIAVVVGSFVVYIIADYMDNKDNVDVVTAIDPPYDVIQPIPPINDVTQGIGGFLNYGSGFGVGFTGAVGSNSAQMVIHLGFRPGDLSNWLGRSVVFGYDNQDMSIEGYIGQNGWQIGNILTQTGILTVATIYRLNTSPYSGYMVQSSSSSSVFYNKVTIGTYSYSYNPVTRRMSSEIIVNFSPDINLIPPVVPGYTFSHFSIAANFNIDIDSPIVQANSSGYRLMIPTLYFDGNINDPLLLLETVLEDNRRLRQENNSLSQQIGSLFTQITQLDRQIQSLEFTILSMQNQGYMPADVFGWIAISFGVIDDFLSIELFPNFNLYVLFAIFWIFPVLRIMLRLFGVEF